MYAWRTCKNKYQPPFTANGRAARSEAKRWRGTRTLQKPNLHPFSTAYGRTARSEAKRCAVVENIQSQSKDLYSDQLLQH